MDFLIEFNFYPRGKKLRKKEEEKEEEQEEKEQEQEEEEEEEEEEEKEEEEAAPANKFTGKWKRLKCAYQLTDWPIFNRSIIP